MGHTSAAILACQFGEHPDQEQTGQRVLQATSMPMIGNPLQTGIQRFQIKHQCLLGKREPT
jgi:hypothetical protein